MFIPDLLGFLEIFSLRSGMKYLLAQVVRIESLVNLIPLTLSVQALIDILGLEEKLLLQTFEQLQFLLKLFDNITEWSFSSPSFKERVNDSFN